MPADRSLVLGASGFVGRHLLRALGPARAVGTFHSAAQPDMLRFDALKDDIGTLLDRTGPFDTTYILIAESRIDRCAAEPERSHALNVASVCRIIDAVQERNILPVFASTDCVFDGAHGGYGETDAAEPILTYGRQKRIVEEYLEASGAPYVVARLSKVVDAGPEGGGMLGEWIRAIRDGKASRCAADQRFSAVDARDVVRALVALGAGAPPGVYHVGGPRPWDRASLFQALVEAIRQHADVAPAMHLCRINDFPEFLESRPLDVSMNSDKLARATGIKAREMTETCAEIARAAFG